MPTAATSAPGPTWPWPAWRAGWPRPTRSWARSTGWRGGAGGAAPPRAGGGVGWGGVLAAVMEANVAALRAGPPGRPALARYTEAAALLTGDPGAAVEDGIAWVRQTLALLAIPGLGAFGLVPEQAGDVAAQALRSSSMRGNPVALTEADLRAILARAA